MALVNTLVKLSLVGIDAIKGERARGKKEITEERAKGRARDEDRIEIGRWVFRQSIAT